MKKIIGLFCFVMIFIMGNHCFAAEWIDYGQADEVDLNRIWKLEFNDEVDDSKIQQVIINNFLGNVEIENTYIDDVLKIDSVQPYLPGVNYFMEIYLKNHKKYKLSFKTKKNYSDEMIVHFLKTRIGQSILIQVPSQKTILLNSSSEIDVLSIVSYLNNLGVDKLDALVLFGDKTSKLGKLGELLEKVKVKKAYINESNFSRSSMLDLNSIMKSKDIENDVYGQGSNLKFDNVNLTVLLNKEIQTELNTVLLLSYKNMQYLISNDLNSNVKQQLLSKHIFKNIEVLVSGNIEEFESESLFLDALNTKYAVLQKSSVSADGGTAIEVLESLNDEFIQTYPTDIVGSVISRTDGEIMQWMSKPWLISLSRGEKWNSKIVIEHIDRKLDRVYIKNYTSKPIELSGWYILSKNGNEKYVFPDGFMLWPGQRMSIQSHIATGFKQKNVINWTNKDIWKDNSDDIGELYDNRGNLRSSYPYSW